jgi:CP family cyanate transporter-like MFS transporter
MWIEDKLRASWAILVYVWLLGFAMFARILCLPPIAHIMKEELSLSHGQVGLLYALPLGILAAISVPSGFLADRIGIRKAGGMGAVIMAVGSFLTGTATNFMTLLVPTALFGVGFSMVFPNLPKLVSVCFSRERAGVATGIYGTGIGTGASLALTITLPVILPITHSLGGTFYIWSLPAIAAAILWWIVVKPPTLSGDDPKVQQGGVRHVSSHGVLKNMGLWLVVLCFFCNTFHFYTWSGWTPKLMMLKGASATSAVLMTSIIQWVSIPTIFLVPWLSHKVGMRKPFIWSSGILLALASWSAMYIPFSFGWPLMVMVGLAVNSTFPMMLWLPLEMVPKESVGMASGLVLSVGYTGGLVGPLLAGYIMDATGGLHLTLIILGGVGIGWALIAFLLPETGSRARAKKLRSERVHFR